MKTVAEGGWGLSSGQTLEQWVENFIDTDETVVSALERHVWTTKRIFYFENWGDDHELVICWLLRNPPEGG